MKQTDRIVRLIETDHAKVGMRDDGIVHVYYKAKTEINIELQAKMLEVFNEITGKQQHPFIFEAGEAVTVTKEARDNAITMELQTPVCCTVVSVTNLAHRIIAEFYYKFNKPIQPYKVTTNFEDGIQWLLDVKKEMDQLKKT